MFGRAIRLQEQQVGEPQAIEFVAPKNRQEDGLGLQLLDENEYFPFLDMPKEIRLMVYDELFQDQSDEHNESLDPQILSTCRTIFEEAYPLYQQSTKDTEVIRLRTNGARTTIKFDGLRESSVGDMMMSTRSCWTQYPADINQKPKVVVHIAIKNLLPFIWLRYQERIRQINHELYRVVTLICDRRSKVQHLDVRVKEHIAHGQRALHESDWSDLLWPLTKNGTIRTTVRGVPKATVDSLEEGRPRSVEIQPALRFHLDAEKVAKDIWRLLESGCVRFDEVICPILVERKVAPFKLTDGGLFNRGSEADLRSRVRDIEAGLNRPILLAALAQVTEVTGRPWKELLGHKDI
ncbi:hypothetical protein HII31_07920 [Pseudocercospora fuligena]|uniref:Uncharacterized protein n=1 Tax=Pseudocercospora fuligena TaxID=685502 RepID=A0A8H6RIP5_9PEZI|nr:hypothetical protein HII31_07920 [Pseudocercospora fuligena]